MKFDETGILSIEPGESCPCKRIRCPRWGDCAACWHHHHLPGKKLPTACERLREKEKKNTPPK